MPSASPRIDLDQCACSGKTLTRFVRPVVLALLAQAPVHGYDILRQLQENEIFADAAPDASGVYKMLKTMTAEGLVTGDWDTKKNGPARRPFHITAKGHKCLSRWADTLESYQQNIVELTAMVNAALRNASKKKATTSRTSPHIARPAQAH